MNYWDTSALVALFVEQPTSPKYLARHKENPHVITAWHAVAECASAFCRLRREGHLTERQLSELLARLQAQSGRWLVVASGQRLEQLTLRVLRLHPLRAMDAIHLAAACLARGEDASRMGFLCEDAVLAEAAAKEGFEC